MAQSNQFAMTRTEFVKLFTGKVVTGFKLADLNGNRCIIVLHIPLEDQGIKLTNMERAGCVKEYAQHRCKFAYVVKIYDANNPSIEYDEAISPFGTPRLVYRVGCLMVEHKFDPI